MRREMLRATPRECAEDVLRFLSSQPCEDREVIVSERTEPPSV